MNLNERGRKLSWRNLRRYPEIYIKGMSERGYSGVLSDGYMAEFRADSSRLRVRIDSACFSLLNFIDVTTGCQEGLM